VVITGCNDQKTLDQAFEAARTFKPLSQSELSALLAKTREAAALGASTRLSKPPRRRTARRAIPQWMG